MRESRAAANPVLQAWDECAGPEGAFYLACFAVI